MIRGAAWRDRRITATVAPRLSATRVPPGRSVTVGPDAAETG
jgi:hypothetical protein